MIDLYAFKLFLRDYHIQFTILMALLIWCPLMLWQTKREQKQKTGG